MISLLLFRMPVRASIWVVLLLDLFVLVVWAAGGAGSFWPVWVWLPTGLAVASSWWVRAAPSHFARRGGEAALISLFLIGVWAAAGHGTFWPVWPIAVLALVFGFEAITRRAKTEAREAAVAALQELRDLARGIHPPILADRGLEAAIRALADHAAVPVSVGVELAERPPAAVETAAYFVAAEGLANALKHARASRIDIAVHERDRAVVVRVLDDGRGGVSESNGGLHGLRQRVEALDGSLRIASPEGGPTVIEAVLPCAR